MHGVYFDEDDGWVIARCACGTWSAGPVPSAEDAADAYGDHRARAALALRASDTPGPG